MAELRKQTRKKKARPVWTMISLPGTTCAAGSAERGGLLRSAPGLRVGLRAEQELRWRERIRREWIVTGSGCMRTGGAAGRPPAAAGVVCTLVMCCRRGLREGAKNLSGKKSENKELYLRTL